MNTRITAITLVLVAIIAAAAFAKMRMSTPPVPSISVSQDPIPSGGGNSLGKLINTVVYTCDSGKPITASYYEGTTTPKTAPGAPPIPGGIVSLTFGDRAPMTLRQTISADGARYASADESFVFWSKGDGAMVLENGAEKDYTNCKEGVPPPPATK